MSLIKRLRFAADVTTERVGENLLTSAAAHLLKPSACRFEVTLLESSSALQSILDLDQLTLSVKLNDPRTGLALMQKTVASGALNSLLTWEDFQTGAPDACHAVFTFSAAETNVELDAVEQEFYLVIEGIDTDGNEVAFCDGTILIEESGAFADPPASVIADDFYTKAQSDSRYLLAADLSGKVNRSGDTMTGLLFLSAAPTLDLHAATKKYVDDLAATKQATLTGGATTIASSNLTASRALASDGSGKVAVSAVTAAELAYLAGVTSALQTQLDAKQATLTGGATTIASANLTASRALASDGSGKVAVSAVTATELGFLAGVTSALQTQIDAKGPAITGGATTITGADLTASRALVSDGSGKVAVATVTAAELAYLSGVASAVQTQLDARLLLTGGTLSGALTLSSGALTLSGAPTANLHAATKLYVDTAAALKLNLAGGTLSGALQFSGTTHAGVRVNNLTNTEITALGSPADGYVVYDTTLEAFRFREASTWKTLGSAGGTTWLSGAGTPGVGDGADGNYYLKDNGAVYFKTSGTWSVFVAAPLPLSGGTIAGSLSVGGNLYVEAGYFLELIQGDLVLTLGNLALVSGNATISGTLGTGGDIAITAGVVKIGGDQILTTRQSAIADATDAGTAISQLNLLLAAARTHGLIST